MIKNEESDDLHCLFSDLVVCSRCSEPLKDHMHCKEEVNGKQQEVMNEDDEIVDSKQFHKKYQKLNIDI